MDVSLGGWFGGLVAAVAGLCVGSFSNVVIFRSPLEGISTTRPRRSFCPQCRHQLTWIENIPIVSWVLQLGRCRACKAWISWRYPAIELLVAALFVSAWWLSPPVDYQGAVTFAVLAYLATVCVIVTVIDIDHLIIPDTITYPGMALGLLASWSFPFLQEGHVLFRAENPHTSALLASALGAVAGGGSLWLVGQLGALFLKKQMEAAGVEDAMGLGDVKWMLHTGAFLGAANVLGAIVQACFLGAAIGILMKVLAWMRGTHAGQPIPFGPFLSAGVLVELVQPGTTWWLLRALSGGA
jgi:leader peptidase (prepilin peptidase)/N-methyltransferase